MYIFWIRHAVVYSNISQNYDYILSELVEKLNVYNENDLLSNDAKPLLYELAFYNKNIKTILTDIKKDLPSSKNNLTNLKNKLNEIEKTIGSVNYNNYKEENSPIIPNQDEEFKNASKQLIKISNHLGINLTPIIFSGLYQRTIQTAYYLKENLSIIKYIVPLCYVETDSRVSVFGKKIEENLVPYVRPAVKGITGDNRELIKDLLYKYGNSDNYINKLVNDNEFRKTPYKFIDLMLKDITSLLEQTYTPTQMENVGIIMIAHGNLMNEYMSQHYKKEEQHINNLQIFLEEIKIKNNKIKRNSMSSVYKGIDITSYLQLENVEKLYTSYLKQNNVPEYDYHD